MAIYPSRFSSDPTLGPGKLKNKSERSVRQMACKTKKSTCKSSTKKTTTKKSSCKKKPC